MPTVRDFILLGLVSAGGKLDGRTTIQKLTYFYGLETGIQTFHVPHYYGPYSRQVTIGLSSLISMGLVNEEKVYTGKHRIMYSYRLTKLGERIGRELQHKSMQFKKIRKITRICDEEARLDGDILALASKVKYIINQTKKPTTYSEVQELASGRGWKLHQAEIDAGVSLLVGLGFARKR